MLVQKFTSFDECLATFSFNHVTHKGPLKKKKKQKKEQVKKLIVIKRVKEVQKEVSERLKVTSIDILMHYASF